MKCLILIGSITTKRAIVDLIKFPKKSGGIINIDNADEDDDNDDSISSNMAIIPMNMNYCVAIL